jgi:hypothetical protein
MKTKSLLSICFMLFVHFLVAQTTYTETFESFTGIGQSFTSNGQTFSLVSKLQLYDAGTNSLPGGLGVGPSDNFVDNGCGSCHVANTSYLTTSNTAAFRLNSLYFYASSYTAGDLPTNNGTITLRGRLNGTTVFTLTKSSGWPTDFSSNNGFVYFNFASNSSWANTYSAADVTAISIDTLAIDMGGSFLYEAFDNLVWTKAPPVLTSTAAATICATSAVLGGTVVNGGTTSVTERGVVYATTANPTTSSSKLVIGSGTGSFSNTISGLTANTLYHFRSYAINTIGTDYGTDLTFTTAIAPSVSTHPSNATVCAGSNTSFTVVAAGTSITYQWQVNTGSGYGNVSNGGVYTNATTATLNITGATAGMTSYLYRCVVTGTCSSTATSNGATLTVNTLPTISVDPSSAAICPAANTSFSVTATGTGITYQWQVNTGSGYNNVSNTGVYTNATTATLNITAATAGMTGYLYKCVVSGTCTPAATSNAATLTMNTAPAVSTHPSNATICAAANTSFTVAATGTSLTYQWQVNTGSGYNNISNTGVYTNATTATLNITAATAGMNGYLYQCVVSGTCTPAATSNAATLTVNSAPSVSTHPSSVAVCPATNTSFTAAATGTSLTYQWQVNTGSGYNNVSNTGVYTNATTATLNITAATAGMTGYLYKCVVSGTCTPAATSNAATLTMNTAPAVSTHPSNATICAAANTSFTVAATGTSLTYQWQVNTGSGYNNISNTGVYTTATTATLNITAATAGMNGYLYQCVVSGTCTPAATSNAATLTVNSAPSVSTHPSNATICSGSNASFTVSATGASLTYQWQESTGGAYSNISNTGVYSTATTATLNITGATAGMNGYNYKCVVTGTCSPTATSNAASLTVNSAPAITTHPSNATTCANTTFTITATGASLTYQWQESTGGAYSNISNTGVYTGTTSATLTITGATASMNGYNYKCVVSGTCSPTATSNAASLTMNTAPSVTTHPSSSTVCLSTNTSFTSAATGTSVTYQWQVDQGGGFSNVSNTGVYTGATTGTLSITGATVGMTGYIYRCVASGTCTPSANSNSATLTVNDANTWTGATNNNFSTGSNWCGGSAPSASANITITGSGNVLIISSGTTTFNNLTLNAGASLTITGGTLNIEGTISGTGTITSSGGTIGFTGTSAQTIPSGLFTSNQIQNLTINNSAGVSLSGTLNLINTLTLTSGTFATNNNLTLISTSGATASIAQIQSGADITGNVNAQRYVPAVNRQFRMFSPSVASFTFSQLIDDMFISGPGGSTNGFDNSLLNANTIYTYKEDNIGTARGWQGITNITNSLAAGKGALIFIRGDRSLGSPAWYTPPFPSQNSVTLDVNGTVNKGDISPTITYTNTGVATADGWNLVGNPYPSPIDWSLVTKSNLGSFYYAFNPSSSSYISNNGSNFIANGQAFFVQATSASPSITFTESSKTSSTPTNYFKSNPEILQANLIQDSLHSDLMWVEFKSGASLNYLPVEDAVKFPNSGLNAGVLLHNDSIRVQHNTIPALANATDTVRLFIASAQGSYTFNFSGMSSINPSYNIYLKDAFTSSTQNLRSNAVYPFAITSDTASQGNNRFSLLFVNPSLLPVELTDFHAERKNNDIALFWKTASEKNNDRFIVQRSFTPNENFETVATVKGKGNSTLTNSYTFTDVNVLKQTTVPTLYYRLKQVDKDERFTYSAVVAVTNYNTIDHVSFYPNPASEKITIRLASVYRGTIKAEIFDLFGKLCLEESTATNNDFSIQVSKLANGIYSLRVTSSETGEHTVFKFVKE